MSSDHGHGAAHAHHHDHDHFDPEPAQELAADETPSAGWLPIVGGALFLVGAVWLFYPGAGAAPPPAPPAPAAVAAPAAPAARAPAAPGTNRPRPAGDAAKRRPLDLKAIPGKRPAPPPTTP